MSQKTNAMRQLEQGGVSYSLRNYDLKKVEFSAVAVAQALNLSPEIVFKTLIARSQNGMLIMACLPGDAALNLKALARYAKQKKLNLVPPRELKKETGYVRGEVTPLGLKRRIQVFIDSSALEHTEISISAGQQGSILLLTPEDLCQSVGGQFAALCLNTKLTR